MIKDKLVLKIREEKMPTGIFKHKQHSEETKKKMSKSRLERKRKLGYLNSPETRRKISKSCKGKVRGMFGKHHTEEAKKKISEGHKGINTWNKGNIILGDKLC